MIRSIANKFGHSKLYEGKPVRVISWQDGNMRLFEQLGIDYDAQVLTDWHDFTKKAEKYGLLVGIED